VLVTGPTGSGKSTLLASLLAHMSLHQGRHMITLEDPIEYHLEEGPNSVVNQRELGEHFTDFASAIRQGLRCDPDVIFVGEMRDRETAQTAVVAAETGHLVFSTLHTYDAQSTVARLVSMYPPEEQDHAREKIAYILRGVVSQTLLPRANHPGRIAAQEIMLDNPAITNNLRAPGGIMRLRDTIQTSRREGMQTMEMALAALVRQGLVTEAEALFRAKNPTEFKRYLQGE
jgi:twitching motility protein PilT